MATMSVRSTYAFDAETVRLLRELAGYWGVSQAEAIRRSVRIAAGTRAAQTPTPAEVLEHYRSQPAPRSPEETERLIADMRAQRQEDDLLRTRWHG
jgi:hypothetical protein